MTEDGRKMPESPASAKFCAAGKLNRNHAQHCLLRRLDGGGDLALNVSHCPRSFWKPDPLDAFIRNEKEEQWP